MTHTNPTRDALAELEKRLKPVLNEAGMQSAYSVFCALERLSATLATQDAASGQGRADHLRRAIETIKTNAGNAEFVYLLARDALASQPTEPAQQPEEPASERTSERHFALREAHHIDAENAFFAARPALDSMIERQAFAYGFNRGFDAAEKCYPATLPPHPQQQAGAVSVEEIDKHLDAILRASGSALRHYSMQKSIDDMRAAMRAALAQQAPQGQAGGAK